MPGHYTIIDIITREFCHQLLKQTVSLFLQRIVGVSLLVILQRVVAILQDAPQNQLEKQFLQWIVAILMLPWYRTNTTASYTLGYEQRNHLPLETLSLNPDLPVPQHPRPNVTQPSSAQGHVPFAS